MQASSEEEFSSVIRAGRLIGLRQALDSKKSGMGIWWQAVYIYISHDQEWQRQVVQKYKQIFQGDEEDAFVASGWTI